MLLFGLRPKPGAIKSKQNNWTKYENQKGLADLPRAYQPRRTRVTRFGQGDDHHPHQQPNGVRR